MKSFISPKMITYFRLDLDHLISKTSRDIFSGLDESHYRILKILAKFGTTNQKWMGVHTSRNYTSTSFDRWGVKKRLDGSAHFIGLIPNGYVISRRINNKETIYSLTLKGILAALGKVRFEKIHLIKEYQEFLKTTTNDRNMLKWSMSFIKFEIALVLYFNNIIGSNWLKYKRLMSYWREFKQYDKGAIKTFFLDTKYLEDKNYDYIKKEYLKLFFILDYITSPIKLGVTHNFVVDSQEFQDYFRKYVDRWFFYIEQINLPRKEWIEHNLMQPMIEKNDEQEWNKEQNTLKKESEKIVREKMKGSYLN